MINQPDKRILQALASLEGQHDFEVIKEWLRTTLASLNEHTAYSKDEVQTRWSQGAQQLLLEFLEKADNARSTLRK